MPQEKLPGRVAKQLRKALYHRDQAVAAARRAQAEEGPGGAPGPSAPGSAGVGVEAVEMKKPRARQPPWRRTEEAAEPRAVSPTWTSPRRRRLVELQRKVKPQHFRSTPHGVTLRFREEGAYDPSSPPALRRSPQRPRTPGRGRSCTWTTSSGRPLMRLYAGRDPCRPLSAAVCAPLRELKAARPLARGSATRWRSACGQKPGRCFGRLAVAQAMPPLGPPMAV